MLGTDCTTTMASDPLSITQQFDFDLDTARSEAPTQGSSGVPDQDPLLTSATLTSANSRQRSSGVPDHDPQTTSATYADSQTETIERKCMQTNEGNPTVCFMNSETEFDKSISKSRIANISHSEMTFSTCSSSLDIPSQSQSATCFSTSSAGSYLKSGASVKTYDMNYSDISDIPSDTQLEVVHNTNVSRSEMMPSAVQNTSISGSEVMPTNYQMNSSNCSLNSSESHGDSNLEMPVTTYHTSDSSSEIQLSDRDVKSYHASDNSSETQFSARVTNCGTSSGASIKEPDLTPVLVPSTSFRKQQYQCRLCPSVFSNRWNCVSHMRAHRRVRTALECATCGKKCSKSSELEIHMRIHTGEKRFACSVCQRRFTRQGQLNSHMNSHSSQKQFLCSDCGAAFVNASNLKRHHQLHAKKSSKAALVYPLVESEVQYRSGHLNHGNRVLVEGNMELGNFVTFLEAPSGKPDCGDEEPFEGASFADSLKIHLNGTTVDASDKCMSLYEQIENYKTENTALYLSQNTSEESMSTSPLPSQQLIIIKPLGQQMKGGSVLKVTHSDDAVLVNASSRALHLSGELGGGWLTSVASGHDLSRTGQSESSMTQAPVLEHTTEALTSLMHHGQSESSMTQAPSLEHTTEALTSLMHTVDWSFLLEDSSLPAQDQSIGELVEPLTVNSSTPVPNNEGLQPLSEPAPQESGPLAELPSSSLMPSASAAGVARPLVPLSHSCLPLDCWDSAAVSALCSEDSHLQSPVVSLSSLQRNVSGFLNSPGSQSLSRPPAAHSGFMTPPLSGESTPAMLNMPVVPSVIGVGSVHEVSNQKMAGEPFQDSVQLMERFTDSVQIAEQFQETLQASEQFQDTLQASEQFSDTVPATGQFQGTLQTPGRFIDNVQSPGQFQDTVQAAGQLQDTMQAAGQLQDTVQEAGQLQNTMQATGQFQNTVQATRHFQDTTRTEQFQDAVQATGKFQGTMQATGQLQDTMQAAGQFQDTMQAAGQFHNNIKVRRQFLDNAQMDQQFHDNIQVGQQFQDSVQVGQQIEGSVQVGQKFKDNVQVGQQFEKLAQFQDTGEAVGQLEDTRPFEGSRQILHLIQEKGQGLAAGQFQITGQIGQLQDTRQAGPFQDTGEIEQFKDKRPTAVEQCQDNREISEHSMDKEQIVEMGEGDVAGEEVTGSEATPLIIILEHPYGIQHFQNLMQGLPAATDGVLPVQILLQNMTFPSSSHNASVQPLQVSALGDDETTNSMMMTAPDITIHGHDYTSADQPIPPPPQRKTVEKMFTCDLCPRHFSRQWYLKVHRKAHLRDRTFTCQVCQASFSRVGNLNRHKLLHTGDRPFPCSHCPARFANSYRLADHERRHEGVKLHRCEVCHNTFGDLSSLRRHQRTHSGDDLHFTCHICGASFRTMYSLTYHLKVHMKEEGFGVTVDDVDFTAADVPVVTFDPEQTSLSRTTSMPPSILKITSAASGKGDNTREYFCSICHKSFPFSAACRQHIFCHLGSQPFKCMDCGATFARKACARRHTATHRRTKRNTCGQCGEKFQTRPQLLLHKDSHLPAQSLTVWCDECGATFSEDSLVMIHKKMFHRQRLCLYKSGVGIVKRDRERGVRRGEKKKKQGGKESGMDVEGEIEEDGDDEDGGNEGGTRERWMGGKTWKDGDGETWKDGDGETAKDGDGETGKDGDGETGKDGDGETGKDGDGETWKDGDGETGKDGDGESGKDGDGESGKDGDGESRKDEDGGGVELEKQTRGESGEDDGGKHGEKNGENSESGLEGGWRTERVDGDVDASEDREKSKESGEGQMCRKKLVMMWKKPALPENRHQQPGLDPVQPNSNCPCNMETSAERITRVGKKKQFFKLGNSFHFSFKHAAHIKTTDETKISSYVPVQNQQWESVNDKPDFSMTKAAGGDSDISVLCGSGQSPSHSADPQQCPSTATQPGIFARLRREAARNQREFLASLHLKRKLRR